MRNGCNNSGAIPLYRCTSLTGSGSLSYGQRGETIPDGSSPLVFELGSHEGADPQGPAIGGQLGFRANQCHLDHAQLIRELPVDDRPYLWELDEGGCNCADD